MGEVGAPFSTYRTRVREEWLDYNGHLHDASYGIVLSEANEELFAALGLSIDYRQERSASMFTVESHIRYLAECSDGQELTASTILVDAGPRTMRLHTELLDAAGTPVATGEYFYLHVDTVRGKVTDLPPERLRRVEQLRAEHAGLPRPAHLGRGVGAPRTVPATGGS
jgi:acyl-CoA thioester hydrolase